MAYEVIKTIKGRAYKYGVRRERDPQTGRVRNRWTYLGRVDERDTVRPKRERSSTSRDALLDAFARLLERSSLDDATADAIALEAGVAHGTFYRHFRNKADAMHALMDRTRGSLAFPDVTMAAEPASRDAVRASLRGYVDNVLHMKSQRPGLMRAWYAMAARDPEFAAERRERRETFASMFVAFIGEVQRRGFGGVTDPEGTARAVFALFDGIFRETVEGGRFPSRASLDAVCEMIDRAVFSTESAALPVTRDASAPRPSPAPQA